MKFILASIVLILLFHIPLYAAAEGINLEVTISSLCGNGVINSGESCDGSNLNSQTCSSQGFTGGTLSCTASCTFNTSACTSAPPPSGGGGYFIPETKVVFGGRAYPTNKVIILKDGQVVAKTVADATASFRVSVSGLSSGNYMFAVYAEDYQGRRSSLLTFQVKITSGVAIELGNIFIAPTIAADKLQVKRGENISIFGQSAPNADITVAINSPDEFFGQVNADANGTYLYIFDTSKLDLGQHLAKSKAALKGVISVFGKTANFTVGTKTVLAQPSVQPAKGDFNHDGRVSLIDFAIAAHWYKRANPPASIDPNGDGKVDLIDFAIMTFYWTG